MQRRCSNPNVAAFALDASKTAGTGNMGRPYRTPSPARESYLTSSNINSPQTASAVNASNPALPELFARPATPAPKHALGHWHGLPSPVTPGFSEFNVDPPSAGSSEGVVNGTASATADIIGDGENKLQQHFSRTTAYADEDVIGGDDKVARELEASLNSPTARRSTRLRAQPKPIYSDASQLPVPTPKIVRNRPLPSHEDPAESQLSFVPPKVDPIAFNGLPTVHSLSWQLQYPPGGSTHPSYPYPTLDPRLIFHQQFVPVVDGLPEFTRVPKLVLPMGWKHVSWSGLLPIAFDSYRQAFKLTPVGPMPLTCEELHQGGLYKYVPGGELHPEYGMLPEMLKLSDGSDGEVYNFDGVDWTLPWEGRLDFHAPTADSGHCIDSGARSDPTSSTFATVFTYPWKEERDCPNMVFDLTDAWRWLSTKEINPSEAFVPTPQKKWHGTGAYRSKRKIKSPIPELMMLAMHVESDSPGFTGTPHPNRILQNQDPPAYGNHSNEFCPFKSVATPTNADITLLADTEFTIMELLSYFPQHYYWGYAADRLSRAGIQARFILDILNMTRGLNDEMMPKLSSIRSATTSAKKRVLAMVGEAHIDEEGQETPAPKPEVTKSTTGYTAEDWTNEVWDKMDYPLLALAHGLQALPTGPDAGPLTALILWCREQQRYQVLISEVPALLKKAGIEPLIEPGELGCPDKEVAARHAGAVKKYRLRLMKAMGVSKGALDDDEERKSKRKKTE
ncbi:hypothetical protein BDW02DRAFT_629199 [Decorospora gaudefroyi]|uniref:Uncharacterized protein n=1 Tax=Decorospora gaudefroyi TaxID=184978 RepID=A0A6A5KD27_9PLEO|nr:hypothetical protein BDW02DRAFT_629199 [Decorospora gaudefroyi]